jgi:hypothetical protein
MQPENAQQDPGYQRMVQDVSQLSVLQEHIVYPEALVGLHKHAAGLYCCDCNPESGDGQVPENKPEA